VAAGEIKWTIAQGTVLTGKTPAPGETVRFKPAFNARGEISTLDIVDDPTVPAFLVLNYQDATPTQTGIFSIEALLLGVGTGRPHQELTLAEAPVQESSFQLFTLEQNEWHAWQARPDFDASTRGDAHCLLDSSTGTITFSDGENGRVPPLGALILATYRVTRAEAGNLAASAVNQLVDSPHNRAVLSNFDAIKTQFAAIVNPMAAHGGAAAETLSHTIGRTLEMMQTPQRAVYLGGLRAVGFENTGDTN
jgi:predicted phage baseplate assembly protein